MPHLQAAGGGAVVNVSSRGAFRGEPNNPAYGASKAGMNAFAQSMALALALTASACEDDDPVIPRDGAADTLPKDAAADVTDTASPDGTMVDRADTNPTDAGDAGDAAPTDGAPPAPAPASARPCGP